MLALAAAAVMTWNDGAFGPVTLSPIAASTSGGPAPTLLIWMDGGEASDVLPTPSEDGVAVIRVKAKRYLANQEEAKGRCFYPAGHLEELAKTAEKRMGWSDYTRPIAAGDGVGGELAYEAAASAPESTFRGALSVSFAPTFEVPKGFCEVTHPKNRFDPSSGKATLVPVPSLKAPWIAVQGEEDPIFRPQSVKEFQATLATASLLTVPGARHALSIGPWRDAVHAAVARLTAPGAEEVGHKLPADVSDLPLHVVEPAEGAATRPETIILVTGDGGWAGIDKSLAAEFAKAGFRTIGWDSLSWYWSKKTPEQGAEALGRVLRSLPPESGAILAGFSFGADLAPFLVNRLPSDVAPRVKALVLIAPSDSATFEIHPIDWLVSANHAGDEPTLPELERLPVQAVCVAPADDRESPCRRKDLPQLHLVEAKGGHHFAGDYQGLAKQILEALDPMLTPRP